MEKLREVIYSALWELPEQSRKTAQEIIMKHAITPKHETVESDGYIIKCRRCNSMHERIFDYCPWCGMITKRKHETVVANHNGKPDSEGEGL